MPRLDHVSIHAVDGDRMVGFLETVLGARQGFRPPFPNPGRWLYLDGQPVIHLDIVARDREFPQGMVNHIAFGVYDHDAARDRIAATGYPFNVTGIPGTDIGQFFISGPEGLLVEVQFRRAAPA